MDLGRFVADEDNRALVLAVAEQALAEISPSEVPLFRSTKEEMIDAAVHSYGNSAATSETVAGISGVADIVSVVVVQIALNVTAQMMYDAGLSTVKAWRAARQSADRKAIEDMVGKAASGKVGRRHMKVVQAVQTSLIQNLTRPQGPSAP